MKLSSAVKMGDKVRCVNSKGWSHFEVGGIYSVTKWWMEGEWGGVHLDDRPVAHIYFEDFEVVE